MATRRQTRKRQSCSENDSPVKKVKAEYIPPSMDPSQFADYYFELGFHMDTEENMADSIREIIKYCNALLNSGGGILGLKCLDDCKTFDSFYDRLVPEFKNLVDGKEENVEKCFHRVSGAEPEMTYLFVQCGTTLSTIDYMMTMPSDSKTSIKREQPTFDFVLDRLKNTESVKVNTVQPFGGLEFEKDAVADVISGPEVVFHHCPEFASGEWSIEKFIFQLQGTMRQYITAFANASSGRILLGVEAEEETNKALVRGFVLDRKQKSLLERGLERVFSRIYWQPRLKKLRQPVGPWQDIVVSGFTPIKNQHYHYRWHNVKKGEDNLTLLEVTVPSVSRGVFRDTPLAYYVAENDNVPSVEQFTFEKWIQAVRATDSELLPEFNLLKRFQRVTLSSSKPKKSIFQYGDSLKEIKEKWFAVDEGLAVTPQALYESLPAEAKDAVDQMRATFHSQSGLCILATRMGALLNRVWAARQENQPDILCDVLLLAENETPRFVTLVHDRQPEHDAYVHAVSRMIKTSVNQDFWFGQPFCIAYGILALNAGPMGAVRLEEQIQEQVQYYPQPFCKTDKETVDKLLEFLILGFSKIVLPLSCSGGVEVEHCLTPEQFGLLWNNYYSDKVMMLSGFSGTGKSVVLEHLIRSVRLREGATDKEILFLCENSPLRKKIKKLDLCQAETRIWLKTNLDKGNDKVLSGIKHVIVDEVHNFQGDDVKWFDKMSKIQSANSGFLWMAMDPEQLTTRAEVGLPEEETEAHVELTSLVRFSKHVAKATAKYVKPENTERFDKLVEAVPHNYEGVNPAFFSGSKYGLEQMIVKQLRWCFEKGYVPGDVALLFRSLDLIPFVARYPDSWEDSAHNLLYNEKTLPAAQKYAFDVDRLNFVSYARVFDQNSIPLDPFFLNIGLPDQLPFKNACFPTGNWLVVDTVDRFSGFDRPVLIIVSPRTKSRPEEYQKFMYTAMAKAVAKLIIIK